MHQIRGWSFVSESEWFSGPQLLNKYGFLLPSRQRWLEFGCFLVVRLTTLFQRLVFNQISMSDSWRCFNVRFLTKFQCQNPDIVSTLFHCCFQVGIWLKFWHRFNVRILMLFEHQDNNLKTTSRWHYQNVVFRSEFGWNPECCFNVRILTLFQRQDTDVVSTSG